MPGPGLQLIADEAAVSVATASRVLNNKPNVAEDTRRRVLATIQRLGGITKTSVIGLLIPDASNPFFSELTFRFQRVFEEAGACVLAASTEGKIDRESYLFARFQQMHAEGIIYVPSSMNTSVAVSAVMHAAIPIVVIDRKLPSGNLDTVVVTSSQATLRAIDYLRMKGHQKIGYLRGPESAQTATDRRNSFLEAMNHHGMRLEEDLIFDGDFSLESGKECAARLNGMAGNRRPTAVMAGNDLMAIGLMHGLQDLGWRLPEQLSVVGFDDVNWANWTSPSLTTIAQPVSALVRKAASLLLRRMKNIEGGALPRRPTSIQLDGILVERNSVAEASG